MLKDIINALSFLTVLPLRQLEIRKNSVLYFPLAGLIIGALLSVLCFLFSRYFPSYMAMIFLLVIYILLTGGLHIDGFTDTVDGLSGGAGNRDKTLNIMSDSRIGTHGAAALVFLLAVKYSLLLEISKFGFLIHLNILKTFLFMPVAGRWAMVQSVLSSKPAKESGLGHLFIGIGRVSFLFPLAFTLAAGIFCFRLNGIIIVSLVSLAAFLMNLFFRKKLGGMTGDTIGFVSEVCEIIFLFSVYFLYK